MSDKLLFTVPECAEVLAIGTSKLWEMVSEGVLESVTIGRARRVTRAELERFVSELTGETPANNGNGP
jgi:excisionase family DNA binding protein